MLFDDQGRRMLRCGLRWLVSHAMARRPYRRVRTRVRAAIVKIDRLGDGVLALGAVRTLLAHYGESESLLVVSPEAELLFAREFPDVRRLVVPAALVHRQILSIGSVYRAQLAEFSCEDVICLRHQRSDWDELVLHWLRGSRTYVLDGASLGRPSPDHLTIVYSRALRTRFALTERAGADFCRELERHRQLLASVLRRSIVDAEVLPTFIHLGGVAQPSTVVVTPFGAREIRSFPGHLLVRAFREIRKYSETRICLQGTSAQHDALLQIASVAKAAGLTGVVCGPPGDTVSYIEAVSMAEVVLTAETATAHIATAYDRPTLVLIGGGHLGEFGPWRRSSRQMWLTDYVDCIGCNWNCRHPEPFCLTRISEEAIAAAVAKLYVGSVEERQP